MLWIPKTDIQVVSNLGIVGDATPGTPLPGNATTLLDGAVTEVISAAQNVRDSWGIEIAIGETAASATASEACADILIGGATDDVLIPSLICGYATSLGWQRYFFPLHVPAGVRIAATLASVRTGITAQIVVNLFGGCPPPWRVGRKVTALGTQANNARGQGITPALSGGAAAADEMIASTVEDYFAFLPGFQPATDTTVSNADLNVGIGVGAATEERIGTWFFRKTSAESCGMVGMPMPAFREVPAGSRITLLTSTSDNANDSAQDGLVYAVS